MHTQASDLHQLTAQREALHELLTHAQRLLCGLPWLTEEAGEAYAVLHHAVSVTDAECLLAGL